MMEIYIPDVDHWIQSKTKIHRKRTPRVLGSLP